MGPRPSRPAFASIAIAIAQAMAVCGLASELESTRTIARPPSSRTPMAGGPARKALIDGERRPRASSASEATRDARIDEPPAIPTSTVHVEDAAPGAGRVMKIASIPAARAASLSAPLATIPASPAASGSTGAKPSWNRPSASTSITSVSMPAASRPAATRVRTRSASARTRPSSRSQARSVAFIRRPASDSDTSSTSCSRRARSATRSRADEGATAAMASCSLRRLPNTNASPSVHPTGRILGKFGWMYTSG